MGGPAGALGAAGVGVAVGDGVVGVGMVGASGLVGVAGPLAAVGAVSSDPPQPARPRSAKVQIISMCFFMNRSSVTSLGVSRETRAPYTRTAPRVWGFEGTVISHTSR